MDSEQDDLSTIDGIVDRIVFHNEENGWTVVRLQVRRTKNPVTAVGPLLGVIPGESLRLWGRWVRDPKWGEQFRIESFVTMKPATLVGIEKYLGSGLIEGIGPVMAERLVRKFGLDTLAVIQHHPDRLTEVEGIGPVRAERIRHAWVEQNEIQQVIIFLQSHGVSSTYAVRIHRLYGSKAIALVQENPYRLATDIHGIGFTKADKIAANLGIAKDSPRRAEACVLHVLGESLGEGHTYLPRADLEALAREFLDVDPEIVTRALDELAGRGEIVIEPEVPESPVYLRTLHLCEAAASIRLRALLEAVATPVRIDVDRAVSWLERELDIRLGAEQKAGVAQAVASKVLVITGGPGTGKTTLVDSLVRIFERKIRRIALCAPTGRAAKRLQEATGREAKTIHRLLEFNPRSMAFGRAEDRPLDADLVIVDEVSMVDVVLFASVLAALPPTCRLILVGDVDQLPSVGPGNVLADVIESGVVPVARLTEIYRQARESLIVLNAHAINHGEMPRMRPEGESGDFYFHESEDPEEILGVVKRLVAERIPRRFGFRAPHDIQVLTPMHKGTLGASRLNEEIQALLNPGESLLRGGRRFRVGDKVMQIQNDYDREVFNGDIGWIAGWDDEQREAVVRFDGREIRYDFADLDNLVLAYACSIHKSQGNEFPAVVIPLHTQHYVMLRRNLLYTAITRGKKLVVVVGSRRALALAVRNRQERPRHSRLAARLRTI